MNAELGCAGHELPGRLVALVKFASGVVVRQTLAQIAAKAGHFERIAGIGPAPSF